MRHTMIVAALAVAGLATACGNSDDRSTPPPTTDRVFITQVRTATPTTTTAAAPNRPRGFISEQTWTAGPWPFTVAEGTLFCARSSANAPMVTFAANREMYALNGPAKTAGNADIAPIWRDGRYGLKVDLASAIAAGTALC